MKTYAYRKADAFTSAESQGNPAACIWLGENERLTDEEMQKIAAQHKGFVTEVVFCKKEADSYALAYYSSESEVPFCGHGTIACMHTLIKETPELLAQNQMTVHTRRKGSITVYNRIADTNAVFITAPAKIEMPVPVTAKEIAAALQVDGGMLSDEYPLDFIDAGNKTLIIPLWTLADEVSIFPDEAVLKAFSLAHGIDVILIFCMDTADPAHRAHTRVFAPAYGYLEDPATGSANSAFGYYMLKHGMWDGDAITLEQGGNDRVYNVVSLLMQGKDLLFGGSATTRIAGHYFV
ncbi:MAG: PhzF family phenazine biosynthesis isomerase [Oscillospiraceae bacterium]|jgi:PhzF family phenazine biosynthesis protein|nr:PhzF family phenazine biosynthesis isomerase [Oscillospiraceae bacterium]